jgi:hypothetical protein
MGRCRIMELCQFLRSPWRLAARRRSRSDVSKSPRALKAIEMSRSDWKAESPVPVIQSHRTNQAGVPAPSSRAMSPRISRKEGADHAGSIPPPPPAGCGAAKDVFVTGGEAHWTITCSQAGATIDGVVIDTLADGKCAFVKAFNDNSGAKVFSPDAKACPKGTRTHFTGLATGAQSISAFLYVL